MGCHERVEEALGIKNNVSFACRRALRDEALFKDPPPKEDCPICFLPMPSKLICCFSLPSATTSSVPIHDYSITHEELAKQDMGGYKPCCGKSICTRGAFTPSVKVWKYLDMFVLQFGPK